MRRRSNKKVGRQNKFINKKILMILIFILLLSLFVFLTLQGYLNLISNKKNYQENSIDIIDQRMSSVLIDINNFPRSAGNDILFLSKLFSLKDVVNSEKNQLDKLGNLKSNFLEFSKENTAYYQLKYINEFGNEIVNVEFDGENSFIVSNSNLKNIKDKYYFKHSMKLDNEEVYLSKIDLNVIDGVLDNRGTEENPIYVPIIIYSTPIFDDYGGRKGIVVSNVYADYFLEEIRRYKRNGEEVFLIDDKGYYLANPDRSKEFGFTTKQDYNFYKDYPQIIKEDLIINGRNKVETDSSIFTFRYIYPTTSSFEIYKGSEKILKDNSMDGYHWVLVSISEKESINKMNDNLRANYLFSLLFYGLIILVIIVLVFFMNFKRRVK